MSILLKWHTKPQIETNLVALLYMYCCDSVKNDQGISHNSTSISKNTTKNMYLFTNQGLNMSILPKWPTKLCIGANLVALLYIYSCDSVKNYQVLKHNLTSIQIFSKNKAKIMYLFTHQGLNMSTIAQVDHTTMDRNQLGSTSIYILL